MPAASLIFLGGALLAVSATELPAPTCAATRMIAEAQAKVPVTEDTHQLRTRLSVASMEADAAEYASDRRERQQRCIRALLAFADLAPDALGRERGESEATRARRLAVELSLSSGPYIGRRVRPPALTPEQKWERRRRRLIGYTAASGIITGIGVLLLTVPWAALVVCHHRTMGEPFACGEGYEAITMSGIGAALFVGGVIPLGIGSYRLDAHLQARPPGTAVFGGRARARFTGSSLSLEF